MIEKKLILILTAAGSSTRMGGKKKEYLPLNGGTVLSEAAKVFLKSAAFNLIIITTPQNDFQRAQKALSADSEIDSLLKKSGTALIFTEGSSTRQKSVFCALKKAEEFLNGENAVVLIHDAARPFVNSRIILDTIKTASEFGGAAPVIPSVDTQKIISKDGTIQAHLERKSIGCIQTPQGFDFKTLFECHTKASLEQKEFTDDTEIFDAFSNDKNLKVYVVEGDVENKKITYPSDIDESDCRGKTPVIRIGFGTDLHRLVEGRKLFLGGVEIPSDKGELGHSDGDVLLHAISDALLGAAALGDIGSYFPDTDPKWKNADSSVLIKKIWADVKNAGWKLENMDCVIEMEKPKFLPWRKKVIESIAHILETDSERIFVKAKTNEKLDSVGAGDAVKVYCTCLLAK